MKHEDTIFHKIIRREIDADIVYEDKQVLAFKDINPVSPTHILIIPKKTIPTLAAAAAEDKELLGHMMLTAANIARERGLAEEGFRVVVNNGEAAGQAVFQLHLHLLGGRGFGWPPG